MVDLPHAMAFSHFGGLVPTYRAASAYAGEDGHVATLADLIEARTLNEQNGWYIGCSAEFVGPARFGDARTCLVIAHGNAALAATPFLLGSEVSEDPHTISRDTFWELAEGKYGPVTVHDFPTRLWESRELSYNVAEAEGSHLLSAMLGHKRAKYLNLCLKWKHEEEEISGRNLENERAIILTRDYHRWGPKVLDEGRAFAHLLGLENVYGLNDHGAVTTITLYHGNETCRMIGIRDQKPLRKIHEGINFGRVDEVAREAQRVVDRLRLQETVLGMIVNDHLTRPVRSGE